MTFRERVLVGLFYLALYGVPLVIAGLLFTSIPNFDIPEWYWLGVAISIGVSITFALNRIAEAIRESRAK